jgi:hypothetical protein
MLFRLGAFMPPFTHGAKPGVEHLLGGRPMVFSFRLDSTHRPRPSGQDRECRRAIARKTVGAPSTADMKWVFKPDEICVTN